MNLNLNILAVEDDTYFRIHLKEVLQAFGIIHFASNKEEYFDAITKQNYHLLITDMNLGNDEDGIEVLEDAKKYKNMTSIVLSNTDNLETIEKAYSHGAHHYLSKDHVQEHLPQYLKVTIDKKLRQEITRILQEKFITKDLDLVSSIARLLEKNLSCKNIFLSGATGTGKSLLASIIHEHIHGPNKPFISINCSEFQENLLESELFGHTKGSFTGAMENKIGKIKMANGGTLFLDELATMPMSMQQKLLKVLDDYEFYPVGSNKKEQSKFTLISATCESLEEKISQKTFREDLFYRIQGFNLHIPSLAERLDDIPLLLKHFQKKIPRKFVIKEDGLEALKNYSFPGNIRELNKLVQELSELGSGIVTKKQIEEVLSPQVINSRKKSNNSSYSEAKIIGLKKFIQNLEQEIVLNSLETHRGCVTEVIKDLKISSSAFYRIYRPV